MATSTQIIKSGFDWRPVVPRPRRSDLKRRWRVVSDLLRESTDQARCRGGLFLEHRRMLRTVLRESKDAIQASRELPHIVFESQSFDSQGAVPRAYAIAAAYLEDVDFDFDEAGFLAYMDCVPEEQCLQMGEIWALQPMLQFAALDAVARWSTDPSAEEDRLPVLITTLLKIREADWKLVFERASLTERVLREDPLGAYAAMDFDSRDLYRSVLAGLASRSFLDEVEVARCAVALARQAEAWPEYDRRVSDRMRHVGYYLLDDGIALLKARIGYTTPARWKLRDTVLSYPTAFYLIGIELTTFATVFFLLSGLSSRTPILAGLLLLMLPATQAAVEFINQITAFFAPPRRLPRLDFSEGIPDHWATLVAVPTLLLGEKQVRENVEDLEIRFLANPDPNLRFALLSDSPDCSNAVEDDSMLVTLARKLIEELNVRYAPSSPFLLLHRRRIFNPAEDVWMGWERKRGKLLELNDLLRGRSDNFPVKVGDVAGLAAVRYVITLDADTQLPKGSAHKMVGAIAHPLNRAIINPTTNTVVRGYGILQPRVGVSVHSAVRSRLAGLYSGQTGFDIYTRAVSNVYQDLFGEGSYTGKGIYEVDALIQVLADRFPSNALLSHDLIEGTYARSALTSDIEVIDDFPSHFRAYSKRKHRWVRGDWQIIFWLFPKAPDLYGRWVDNPLSIISRWKILDNLRRSLIEIATLCLFLAGWFVLPGGPAYWTVATTLLLLIPVYSQFGLTLLRIGGARHVRGFLQDAESAFVTGHLNVLLTVIFLPYQALVALDAIVRVTVRRTITRKRLLQWETAAQAESDSGKTSVDIYLDVAPVLAVVTWIILNALRPQALPAANPILLLWFSSKLLAQWLNRPPRPQQHAIADADREYLRSVALRTWGFFQEFGGERENFLIPDNVQLEPAATAHRISPTNMGMLLNARLAACDLGFITTEEFVEATAATLSTMERLPRYGGHFFNWYDTQTLTPLDPLFVSTVDSGNLAACLWTLRQGCLDLRSQIPQGERLDELAAKAGALVDEMDFGLVYNSKRKTLSVGFDVNTNRQETACYDLLASEARMASFIAIAKNDVPLESWFHLGRAHTRFLGRRILLSWTGTMFEYLLPSLWMRVFPNTILERSLHAAVSCQRSIARRERTPWGISEAAYCVTDQDGNYQYRAFGVSELALKCGISGAVVAPYASALALGVSSTAAIRNLRKMESMGWTGTYGFFDSADFHNPEEAAVVRAWMAHHQGMILLAIANALTGSAMQRRFHAEPFVKANELILDEKAPSSGPCDVPVREDRARATAVPGYDSVDI